MPELVQCVVVQAHRGTGGKRMMEDKSITRMYHSIVGQGKMCSAVRVASTLGGGGVYAPEDTDMNSG